MLIFVVTKIALSHNRENLCVRSHPGRQYVDQAELSSYYVTVRPGLPVYECVHGI